MFKIASSIVNSVKQNTSILKHQRKRLYSLYTPDYLDAYKPKIPEYPSINIRINGYVFSILESYQQFIHNVAETMNFDVTDSFALPPTHLKIQRYKVRSSIVDDEYQLKFYERNFKINRIPTTQFPIFLRILEAAQPEGIILNIDEWNPLTEELRYVPDKELLDLRSELDNFQRKK